MTTVVEIERFGETFQKATVNSVSVCRRWVITEKPPNGENGSIHRVEVIASVNGAGEKQIYMRDVYLSERGIVKLAEILGDAAKWLATVEPAPKEFE